MTDKKWILQLAPSTDRGASVVEKNGAWWWADEGWGWHGPCSTERSARARQSLYAKFQVHGAGPHELILKPRAQWRREADEERENVIHPCHCWEPWECGCAGACSCHWIEQKERLP